MANSSRSRAASTTRRQLSASAPSRSAAGTKRIPSAASAAISELRHGTVTAFRFVPIEGISVFYWHDEKLAYALAAELPREQLKAICNEVYARLNPGGGPMDW